MAKASSGNISANGTAIARHSAPGWRATSSANQDRSEDRQLAGLQIGWQAKARAAFTAGPGGYGGPTMVANLKDG